MALACGLLDLSLSYVHTECVCVPEPGYFGLSEGTFVQSDPWSPDPRV